MGADLAIALIVFLASAASVVFLGRLLAKFGDVLATLTGWGRLFVGSILIALATSFPELSTNITAVSLQPPNPELAVGNILGANMVNMFTLSLLALFFGGRRFLQQVAPQQGYLIVLAAGMTGMVLLFGALKLDASLWQVGLGAAVLLGMFLAGMRVVYLTRPKQDQENAQEEEPGMTLARAWVMFGLVSAGVIVAGIFLAWSTDRVAEITGVSSSTLGILAVAVVTTMPEAASTYFAVRMGAPDLGVSGLFGSCAFNVTILCYADPFYRDGVLINQVGPAHFVAGGVAVLLILVSLALILGRDRIGNAIAKAGLVLMALIYITGAIAVIGLGRAEGSSSATTGNHRIPGNVLTFQTHSNDPAVSPRGHYLQRP